MTTASAASAISTATSSLPTTTTTAANGTQTTTSPGSSILTALGVGTGIDMTNLASEIATATYSSQTSATTAKLSAVQVQITEAGQLQTDMASLVSSFATLVGGGSLSATPSVTNANVATASLPAGMNGAGHSYSLEVTQLAQAQVLASPAFSSSTATTGSGTLSIQLGTITPGANGAAGTFAAGSGGAVSVTINQGDSLATIAQDINASGAGITAYVANTAAGAKLVMQGPSGAASAFTVTASENAADPGLAALNYAPGAATTATSGSTLAQSAQDAKFSIDGIAQTSATNAIQNAAPALNLSLTGTNAGNPTTITYSDPSAGIANAMTNLTSALNTIVGELNTDMKASPTGSLANDGGARAMQKQLSALASTTIMPNAATGAPATLADLGLTLNKDGSFTFNPTKLSGAQASNPAAVAAMFTNGLHGVYSTLFDISTAVSASNDPGSLAGSVTYFTAQQTTLTTQKTNIANQQAALQSQLLTSLGAANTSVADSKSTMSFLTQQIAAWTGKTSG